MKTNLTTAPAESREERFAEELYRELDHRGCFVGKIEKRRIRQAFERHFREVFSAVYCHPNSALESLRALVAKLEVMNGAHEVNVTAGHEEEYPEINRAREIIALATR